MTGSYRRIDYRLRPAKHAERLMMCDAFRRLRFGTVESYQYVGLGSVYFSDFVLFHRSLGINKMVSIECEIDDQKRFDDNLPFSNIEMCWGFTTTELPKVDLELRSIIWLDYDGRLTHEVLDDVRSVVSRIGSGSVLAITVQCNVEKVTAKVAVEGLGSDGGTDKAGSAIERLAKEIGGNRIDSKYDDESLLGWGTARILREVIVNEMTAVLAQRNGIRPDAQRLEFEQILNFHYADGARMLTVGCVFFDRGQRNLFDQCAFDELPFIRRGEDAFQIDIPRLTPRELRFLEKQMPLKGGTSPEISSMPKRDAEWFVKIYRYFPNFFAVDL